MIDAVVDSKVFMFFCLVKCLFTCKEVIVYSNQVKLKLLHHTHSELSELYNIRDLILIVEFVVVAATTTSLLKSG